eukprot:3371198-Amphidinium_carterae.1
MQLEPAAPSSPSELPVPTDFSALTSSRQASVAPTSPPSPISVPPLQARMHQMDARGVATDAHAPTEVLPPIEGVVRPHEEASAVLPTDVPLITDVPPPTDIGRRTQEDEAI